jgi:hypothetical protein
LFQTPSPKAVTGASYKHQATPSEHSSKSRKKVKSPATKDTKKFEHGVEKKMKPYGSGSVIPKVTNSVTFFLKVVGNIWC